MTDVPDTQQWINRIQSGDYSALATLLEYYRPRLRQMISMRMDSRLTSRFDGSDVIQDVFLDANRQISAYVEDPRVEFYVWLRGLAWQRLLNLQRHHTDTQGRTVRREVPLPLESTTTLLRELVGGGPTPSKVLSNREVSDRVQTALDQLKPDDREVILMRHFEPLTNNEVAQTLEITPSAATMRYGRAMFRLKELLREDFDHEE